MNIVIIEDEAPAMVRIKKLITQLLPEVNILGTADSIEASVALFNKHSQINLAFMDIELADGQSFEIFNQVNITCPVIFTTAYDEYALKAFKVNAIDYLLKPIEETELQRAIKKYKTLGNVVPTPNYQEQFSALLKEMRPSTAGYKNRFLIKTGTRLVSIPVEEMAVFHAADKTVYVHTIQQQKYIMDYSLDELSKLLNPDYFFQLNRQVIAHIGSIRNIHTYFNGKLKVELTHQVEDEILVSRERAGEFKTWLDR